MKYICSEQIENLLELIPKNCDLDFIYYHTQMIDMHSTFMEQQFFN